MSQIVYKFSCLDGQMIDGFFLVPLPERHKVFHVGRDQNALFTVWVSFDKAEYDENFLKAEDEKNYEAFVAVMTGQPFDEDELEPVGTIIASPFVIHIMKWMKPVTKAMVAAHRNMIN